MAIKSGIPVTWITAIAAFVLSAEMSVGQIVAPPAPNAGAEDDEVITVLLQPADNGDGRSPSDTETQPADLPRQPSRVTRSLLGSRRSTRVSRTPPMFGDFFATGGTLQVIVLGDPFRTDVPLGGGRHAKVAENNRALTDDRVYFSYNHFHNALEATDFLQNQQFSVDRFTLGYERSFCDQRWSVELRLPLVSTFQFLPANPSFGISGGNIGNVAAILKRMLFEGDRLAVAGGIGVDIPTGSNVEGFADQDRVAIHNDAFHILPFIGALWAPRENVFFHAFLQLDLAANGNDVEFGPAQAVYTEQNLLLLDLAGGYWVHRDPCARFVTGVAATCELHFTGTIQQSDQVFLDNGLGDTLLLFNFPDQTGVLNATVGLHAALANDAALRAAVVLPVGDVPNRFFDGELWLSYIKQL